MTWMISFPFSQLYIIAKVYNNESTAFLEDYLASMASPISTSLTWTSWYQPQEKWYEKNKYSAEPTAIHHCHWADHDLPPLQSTLLFDLFPVASLYISDNLSNSAACWDACFLSVSMYRVRVSRWRWWGNEKGRKGRRREEKTLTEIPVLSLWSG
jgi:hypothetical protein